MFRLLHLVLLGLLVALALCYVAAAAPGSPKDCYPGYFECADGTCIPTELVCNGEINCITGNDEDNCTRAAGRDDGCFTGYYECSNGLCIPEALVCDGEINCVLGDDEVDC